MMFVKPQQLHHLSYCTYLIENTIVPKGFKYGYNLIGSEGCYEEVVWEDFMNIMDSLVEDKKFFGDVRLFRNQMSAMAFQNMYNQHQQVLSVLFEPDITEADKLVPVSHPYAIVQYRIRDMDAAYEAYTSGVLINSINFMKLHDAQNQLSHALKHKKDIPF